MRIPGAAAGPSGHGHALGRQVRKRFNIGGEAGVAETGIATTTERKAIMDQKQIMKQLLDFNRTAFNNGFNAMVLMQDQFERVTQVVLERTDWLPEEGRNAISDWTNTYKAGRDSFKQYIDESYQKIEPFFTS